MFRIMDVVGFRRAANFKYAIFKRRPTGTQLLRASNGGIWVGPTESNILQTPTPTTGLEKGVRRRPELPPDHTEINMLT